MARDFMMEMLHSFDKSISGWGLDVYWGYHLGKSRTAGILDCTIMRHTKGIDLDNGEFYKYLRGLGIDPHLEMCNIFDMLKITEYNIAPSKFVFFNLMLRPKRQGVVRAAARNA
jgi:hypothetical protein